MTDGSQNGLVRSVLGEFVGSILLLAIVVGSGIMGQRLSGGNDAIALLANSIATWAGLMVLITALGPISGAHFNPVVTMIEALDGRLPVARVPWYLAAQVTGCILGVFLAHAMFDVAIVQHATKVRFGINLWIAETVATFGLVAVVILVARVNSAAAPSIVSAWILSAYWFTSSTSFANPAVTFARSFTDTFCSVERASVPGFVVVQVVGATLAWAACRQLGRGTNVA